MKKIYVLAILLLVIIWIYSPKIIAFLVNNWYTNKESNIDIQLEENVKKKDIIDKEIDDFLNSN